MCMDSLENTEKFRDAVATKNIVQSLVVLRKLSRPDKVYYGLLGSTPMIHAIKCDMKEVVEVMFDMYQDIDVEAKDSVLHGTALHAACITENTELVSFLLSKGANPNSQDTYGRTPLYFLCQMGNIDLIYILLKAGANPFLISTDGSSPYSEASEPLKHFIQLTTIHMEGYTCV